MGAEECVKLLSWHVSDLHVLNPQDAVLDFFFFLGCYRNIYTLVPSLSEGKLTPVDFEKHKAHKPRRWMSAIAEGKGTYSKKGVIPLVVNVQIQEEPLPCNLLFTKYCQLLTFSQASKQLSPQLQYLTLIPQGAFSSTN